MVSKRGIGVNRFDHSLGSGASVAEAMETAASETGTEMGRNADVTMFVVPNQLYSVVAPSCSLAKRARLEVALAL
jgi:hypothetical protein